MAKSRALSVVPDDAKPALARKRAAARTVKGSLAEDRTEREFLVAMRAALAETIDGKPAAHALAGLMRQARELDKEIRAIDARAREGMGGGDGDDGDLDEETYEDFDPDSV